jgi:antitoxin component YwqK of YwqJK toxin-antitoxin module
MKLNFYKIMMMRVLILIISTCICNIVFAQKDTIIKYYDSSNNRVPQKNAHIYTYYVDDDSVFRCWSYFKGSNKLAAKFTSLDTALFARLYRYVSYFENGNTKDSMFFYAEEQNSYRYSFYESGAKFRIRRNKILSSVFEEAVFYENGPLKASLSRLEPLDEAVCISYDTLGNVMPDYIFEQEAEFKGGRAGWIKYLQRNLNTEVPFKNGAPPGKYTTKVEFLIETDGTVTNVKSLNDGGFGTKEEAERVLRNSPKWKPAIQENKPVKYRAKQPITFAVSY